MPYKFICSAIASLLLSKALLLTCTYRTYYALVVSGLDGKYNQSAGLFWSLTSAYKAKVEYHNKPALTGWFTCQMGCCLPRDVGLCYLLRVGFSTLILGVALCLRLRMALRRSFHRLKTPSFLAL